MKLLDISYLSVDKRFFGKKMKFFGGVTPLRHLWGHKMFAKPRTEKIVERVNDSVPPWAMYLYRQAGNSDRG